MKKVLQYLLLLMICTIFPLNVLADCVVGFVNVKATISNKEGAKIYKWEEVDGDRYGYVLTNEILSYGETVTIQYESNGYANIEKSGGGYYIKSTDYSHEGDTKAESENYIKYYAYAETFIRNVPSFYSYDVVEKIPANTYFDIAGSNNYVISGNSKWAVAKYNGKSGWVYVGGCRLEDEPITIANKYEKPLSAYAIGIYDSSSGKYNDVTEGYAILGNNSTKKNISIKHGEKVKILYKHQIGHHMYQYIQSDSIDGIWVYDTIFYVEEDKNVIFEGLEYDGKNYNTYTVNDFESFMPSNLKLEENKLYNYKYKIINIEGSGYAVELNGNLYWILIAAKSGVLNTELEKQSLSINLDDDYKFGFWFNDGTKEEGIVKKGQYNAYRLNDRNNSNYDDIYYIDGYGFIKYKKTIQVQKEEINPSQVSVRHCVYGAFALTIVAGIIIVILYVHGKKNKNCQKYF